MQIEEIKPFLDEDTSLLSTDIKSLAQSNDLNLRSHKRYRHRHLWLV